MTRIPTHQRLVASVFDRLIEIKDTEEAQPQNPMSLSLAELQTNVFRDLQSMLNSRRALTEGLDETSELRQSVVTYGLPDITSINPESREQQANIRQSVEDAIRMSTTRFRLARDPLKFRLEPVCLYQILLLIFKRSLTWRSVSNR